MFTTKQGHLWWLLRHPVYIYICIGICTKPLKSNIFIVAGCTVCGTLICQVESHPQPRRTPVGTSPLRCINMQTQLFKLSRYDKLSRTTVLTYQQWRRNLQPLNTAPGGLWQHNSNTYCTLIKQILIKSKSLNIKQTQTTNNSNFKNPVMFMSTVNVQTAMIHSSARLSSVAPLSQSPH